VLLQKYYTALVVVNERLWSIGGMVFTVENLSIARKYYKAWVVVESMSMVCWWNGTDRRNLENL